MSDESMDDLIVLYRKAAHEAPLPKTDARILQMAQNQCRVQRRTHHLAWFVASAACVLLWFAAHRPATQVSTDNAAPGYLDGHNRTDLMTMDIAPPPSPTVQFLLSQGAPSN